MSASTAAATLPHWRPLLDEALRRLAASDHGAALQYCDRAALLGPRARYQAAVLRGDILLDLGDPLGALSAFETVADVRLPDPIVDCGRGLALFELGRFAEAQNALHSAITGYHELPEAHFALGIIAEIYGYSSASAWFRSARRLAPDRFPHRASLSNQEFRDAVDQAMAALSTQAKSTLRSLQVVVTPMPHPEDVRRSDLTLSPLALSASPLEAFRGPNTPRIVLLYKRNLERAGERGESLVKTIREALEHQLRRVA